jgi:ribosomal-protein-alanine N-acetyltransferase
MSIIVNEQIHLTEFRPTDKAALILHLNDRNIYERTLRIPFPYAEADADAWMALAAKANAEHRRPTHWAIRTADRALIGGGGFDGLHASQPHRAEIGYWLATPYWGRGIMTAVVRRLCEYAFAEHGLAKITAHVFTHNPASARVLEKCGFEQEGLLRRHFLKDGRLVDARLFALLK